jgi:bifunctional UDP-N-acetylglucosamine pyrophosphorylase/glucosamine-1-phosphate N-acetyltransferase
VSHLTYIGDSKWAAGSISGCGTVTDQLRRLKKHMTGSRTTRILACNTNLVAPVRVAGWLTAAGSTITKDVPECALAIARSRQETKRMVERRKSLKLHRQRLTGVPGLLCFIEGEWGK